MESPIYLDYNATALMRPEVVKALNNIHNQSLNASSIHSYGREGRRIVEDSRNKISRIVNCPPAQIIFNSGATEGNNTVLNHFKNDRILTSKIEHPSVLDAISNTEQIPIKHEGIIDLDALETCLKDKPTALVSVMMVNNETGVIQPMKEIVKLAKDHGSLVHCDAVQALGRIPIDMKKLGIDFLTLSAHKVAGPQGVGALALGLCGITPTLLRGGGQEKSARAGTENIAGIAGFGIATEIAETNRESLTKKLKTLQNKLEDWMKKNEITIHGQNAARVANTTFFSVPGLRAETALMAMDIEGVAISNGSACSSGTVKASHVLKAMGASEDEAESALRISTGWATKAEDIEVFINKFDNFLKRTNKK